MQESVEAIKIELMAVIDTVLEDLRLFYQVLWTVHMYVSLLKFLF